MYIFQKWDSSFFFFSFQFKAFETVNEENLQ